MFKLQLAEHVPIDRDVLHIAVGAAIMVLALLLIRTRKRAVMTGFGASLFAAIAMEVADLWDTWGVGATLRWDLSGGDLVRTMIVPATVAMWHVWRTSRVNGAAR